MEPMRFRCRSCDQALRVPAEKAGRKVRCNRCGAVLLVPAADDPAATTDDPAPTRPHDETTRRPRPRRQEEPRPAADDEPPAEEEAGEAREEGRPRKRRKGRPADSWRLARLGLLVLLAGFGLQLLAEVVGQVVVSALAPRLGLRSFALLNTFLWVSMGFSGFCALVQAAGFGLCLFAPGESEARPFAGTA